MIYYAKNLSFYYICISFIFYDNAKIVKYSLLFISGKKAILLYERCAYFTAQSASNVDRVCRSCLSDGRLSKHSSQLHSLIYL